MLQKEVAEWDRQKADRGAGGSSAHCRFRIPPIQALTRPPTGLVRYLLFVSEGKVNQVL